MASQFNRQRVVVLATRFLRALALFAVSPYAEGVVVGYDIASDPFASPDVPGDPLESDGAPTDAFTAHDLPDTHESPTPRAIAGEPRGLWIPFCSRFMAQRGRR